MGTPPYRNRIGRTPRRSLVSACFVIALASVCLLSTGCQTGEPADAGTLLERALAVNDPAKVVGSSVLLLKDREYTVMFFISHRGSTATWTAVAIDSAPTEEVHILKTGEIEARAERLASELIAAQPKVGTYLPNETIIDYRFALSNGLSGRRVLAGDTWQDPQYAKIGPSIKALILELRNIPKAFQVRDFIEVPSGSETVEAPKPAESDPQH